MPKNKDNKNKKKVSKSKKPPNRPTDYTPEIAEEICDVVAENAKGLKPLCEANPHWPRLRTIRRWIRENEDFRHMYARAKEDQADLMADEIIEISDDTTHDTLIKQDRDGNDYEACNSEWINRSRLRVDSRKWLASKLRPKQYGEKVVNEHSGLNGAPIEYANLTVEERNSRIAEILETARARRADDACGLNSESEEPEL